MSSQVSSAKSAPAKSAPAKSAPAKSAVTLAMAQGHMSSILTVENMTAKETLPHYPPIAQYLAQCLENGDAAAIHAFLCSAQDNAAGGITWNRVISAIKSALAKLPKAVVFTETRHFDPNYRKAHKLFALAYRQDVTLAKREAEAETAKKEEALRLETASRNAAAATELDRLTTAHDLAAAVLSEALRLNISLDAITVAMADLIAEHVRNAAAAPTAAPTAAVA